MNVRPASALRLLSSLALVLATRGVVLAQCQPVIVSTVDTPGTAYGVAVSNGIAYVADGHAGLQVIDVSDPASPVTLGSVGTPAFAGSVAVSGSLAFVTVADGSPASSALLVVDVADPASPAVLGSAPLATPPFALAVQGSQAFLPLLFSGVTVIDASDPTQPGQVGSFGPLVGAQDLAVVGNRAYLASPALVVYDVSDPANAALLGSSGTLGLPQGVAVSGGHAYVAVEAWTWINGSTPSGLHVLDLSSSSPSPVGFVPLGAVPTSVAASGHVAYVGSAGGLTLVDVRTPDTPLVLGSLATPDRVRSLGAAGANVYAAVEESGLIIGDVSTCIDTDGDGVNDAEDECPSSNLEPILVVHGEATGVENVLLASGCTLADLVGAFLATNPSTQELVAFLVTLKAENALGGLEMGAILKAYTGP